MKVRRGIEETSAIVIGVVAVALAGGGLYLFLNYDLTPKGSSSTTSFTTITSTSCSLSTGSGFSTTFSVCATVAVTLALTTFSTATHGGWCIGGWCFSVQGGSFAVLASLATVAGVVLGKPSKEEDEKT